MTQDIERMVGQLIESMADDGLTAIPLVGDPVPLVITHHPERWTWERARRHVAARAAELGLLVQVEDHDGLPDAADGLLTGNGRRPTGGNDG